MAQIGKLRRQILQSIDDQMSDAVLSLQEARGKESSGQAADAAITFPHMGPDNQIGGAGFIFESDECRSLGSSRPLPHENQAGDAIAHRPAGRAAAPLPRGRQAPRRPSLDEMGPGVEAIPDRPVSSSGGRPGSRTFRGKRR